MTTHLVVPDCHATPGISNRRAEWLGHLICDLKPTTVVFLGDCADMPSLCSYDKGKKSFQGRTYKADIDAHHDFQDRVWSTVRRAKRKLPKSVCLIGNHEQRIERAIETQPELEGVISYRDLGLENWYDTVVDYNGATPGCIEIDGVSYSHYMVSGISGRPISGEHSAYSLLTKKFSSCVVGHSHILDFATRTRGSDGRKITGLVGGCYFEHDLKYAGEANNLYWRGVHLLNVDHGAFDVEMISMDRIKKAYGPQGRGYVR